MFQNFEDYELLPSDPIFSLSQEAIDDKRTDKVDLTIGIYKTPKLQSMVFSSIKLAEQALLEEETNKDYLSIDGDHQFIEGVKKLVLGTSKRKFCGVQALGGTGALRVGADFLAEKLKRPVYLSSPTWVNHHNIFKRAGFEICSYPYYDKEKKEILFEELLETLSKAPAQSIIVFHGCCHNPTGVDPTYEQWQELALLCKKQELIPFFDLAYQGFGANLDEDVKGIRFFAEEGLEILISTSHSKNFGMYGERVGCLLVLTDSSEKVLSHLKAIARASYSNPPRHGALLVAKILSDPSLRQSWMNELAECQWRLQTMRTQFAELLKTYSQTNAHDYLKRCKGMFCYLDLAKEQIHALKADKAIYLTGSGRINVTGLNDENIDYVARSIVDARR